MGNKILILYIGKLWGKIMPIGKFFGINPAQTVTNPFQVTKHSDNRFVQNAFNFENANPNRPESRDDIHGRNLYCLA